MARTRTMILIVLLLIAFAVLSCAPHIVYAGSASYSSPGGYYFSVPAYGTLTVQVWGAGGGGGGYSAGGSGAYSVFNGQVVGYGGAGANSQYGGAGGGAEGGDANYSGSPGGTAVTNYGGNGGSGAYGGAGGAGGTLRGGVQAGSTPGGGGGGGGTACANCSPPYGGGGGGGGYAYRTYYPGQLSGSVYVYVGNGGAGGAAGGYYSYTGDGAAGGNGYVQITWTDMPPATCSVSLSPSTINQGSYSYLSWSSSNANSWVYINNIGYVGASGGTYVAPSSTTDYSCYARGSGGDSGWQPAALTVNASCSFNGSTVTHGSSVTAYQASSVAYGSSCASQTRTCSNGSLSGSYAYASCSVASPSNCSLNGQTVAHGASQTFYSQQTSPVGGTCSTVSLSRTCTNGTLSGSSSYQYASCSCAPIYSCSGNNIQYTNASCATSTVTSCASPSFCTAGQSTCQYNSISFSSFSATGIGGPFTASGHLQVRPSLVRVGNPAYLYWNVSDAASCTVSGSNGDSWSTTSSPSAGRTSSPITSKTIFTLNCTAHPGVTPTTITESVSVVPAPKFNEN